MKTTIQRLFISATLIFLGSIITSNVNAQSFFNLENTTKTSTALIDNDQLSISYLFGECNNPSLGTNKEMAYLTVTNKTDQPISLSWKYELKYGEKCFNCDGHNSELNISITVPANSTISSNCDRSINELQIFSRFVVVSSVQPPITSLIIKDFKIN